MKKTIIEQCWDEFSRKDSRFSSVIISTSVCGRSLEEIKELSNQELVSLLPNALLEWEITGTRDKPGQCACSVNIPQSYILTNKLNKNALIIGPECIKKYGTASHKKFLSIHSKKYTGDRIACCYCGAYRIAAGTAAAIPLCKSCKTEGRTSPSSEYLAAAGKRCSTCKTGRVIPESLISSCSACATHKCAVCTEAFRPIKKEVHCPYCTELLKNWRVCVSCKSPDIPISEPSWKTKCAECYRNSARTISPPVVIVGGRTCLICKENNISVTEPSWKKVCMDCFLKTRSAEPVVVSVDRICSSCKKTKLDPSEPSWKTMCMPCFKYGRKELPSVWIRTCDKCHVVLHTSTPANCSLCPTCYAVQR